MRASPTAAAASSCHEPRWCYSALGALSGVLAHAVGNWVLVERLAIPAPSQEGRCLGLLPALLERTGFLKPQQQEQPADSPRRSGSLVQSAQEVLQQQQSELLHQCGAVVDKPRIAVLRHPAVGRSIAFSLDTTARLAATISGEDYLHPMTRSSRLLLSVAGPKRHYPIVVVGLCCFSAGIASCLQPSRALRQQQRRV